MLMSFFNLIYFIEYKPFRNSINNFMESLNEGFYLVTVYYMFIFSDIYEDYNMKYMIGWSFIAVVALQIIINFSIIIIISFKDLIKLLKKQYPSCFKFPCMKEERENTNLKSTS